MPRDEDEDLSTPLDLGSATPQPARPRGKSEPAKVIGKPLPPAAPAPPPPPPALKWGVCGVVHQFGELIGYPGSSGIIRFVSSGVSYTAPPLNSRWRGVPSEPGRFEMAWDNAPEVVRTLRTLRSELDHAARAGELAHPRHPLLHELDEVATSLTALVAQLHAEGWSVGLLQPESIVIREHGGAYEAVPVDLGFTWKGSFGKPPWEDNPGRPDWIEPHANTRWLWDRPPVEQQFAAPKNGCYEPAAPDEDVRVLGRLLAWLLAGQPNKDVRTTAGAPATWVLLADAANGQVASADEFVERLQQAPLSAYFSPRRNKESSNKKTSNRSRIIPRVLASLLCLGALAGGAWYFVIRKPAQPQEVAAGSDQTPEPTTSQASPPKEPAQKPEVPKDPIAFENELKRYDALAANDFKGLFAGLKKLYASAAQKQLPIIAEKRAKVIDNWVIAVREAIHLGDDPAKRLDAAARLDELEAELTAFIGAHPSTDPAQQEKEKQCLDYVATFARQFGPPR